VKYLAALWFLLMFLLGIYLLFWAILNPGIKDWPMSLLSGYVIATAGREFFEALRS